MKFNITYYREMIGKRFAILNPTGELVLNVLETTELWCWAILYSKRFTNKQVPPSLVPPDFINGLKEIGYRVVEVSFQDGDQQKNKREIGVTWYNEETSLRLGMRILAQDVNGRYVLIRTVEGVCLDDGTCLVDYVDESGKYVANLKIAKWMNLDEII